MSTQFNIAAHFSLTVSLHPCVSFLRESAWRQSNHRNHVRFPNHTYSIHIYTHTAYIPRKEFPCDTDSAAGLVLARGVYSCPPVLSGWPSHPVTECGVYCGYNDFIPIPASSLLTLVFIVPRLSAVSHTEFDLSVQRKRTVVVVPMVVYQPNMFSCQSAQDITHIQTPCPA